MSKFQGLIQKLNKIFKTQQQLPGYKAHKELLPKHRIYETTNPQGTNSAVLILLFPNGNNPYFVLVKRIKDNSAHSGQISLPGGGYEEQDKSLIFTALRETREEIGVEVPFQNVLGQLTPIYISVSNYNVFPFIAFCNKKPKFSKNPNEIEKIFTLDVENFLTLRVVKKEFNTLKGIIEAPAFVFDLEYIWGATAMILNEFKFLIQH